MEGRKDERKKKISFTMEVKRNPVAADPYYITKG